MNEQQKFAVFDIDGTLIRWQLFHAIADKLGKNDLLPAEVHSTICAARRNWKVRGGNFSDYEETLVKAYLPALTNVNPTDYERVVTEVYEEYKDQVYTYTRDLIKSLKNEGYLIFAISGSPMNIVKLMAAHYGFDDCIGEVLNIENGKFNGERSTPIHNKRKALDELMGRHNTTIKGSIGVGDSEGDIAMLETVENPIAFNPARGLFEVASNRGWNIVIERKSMVYQLDKVDGSYVLAKTN